jgi:hypothetical protein
MALLMRLMSTTGLNYIRDRFISSGYVDGDSVVFVAWFASEMKKLVG